LRRPTSDARWQVGEASAAGNHLVEFVELLIAAMIATFGDELARDVELLPRFLCERRRSVRIRQDRPRRAPLNETV
jgi:hypothetical protein